VVQLANSKPNHEMTPANAQNATNRWTKDIASKAQGNRARVRCRSRVSLLFDLVCSSEHVVNVGEVVGAREQVLRAAFWREVLLEMGSLANIAHLRIVR
jgi:hypothetical protein